MSYLGRVTRSITTASHPGGKRILRNIKKSGSAGGAHFCLTLSCAPLGTSPPSKLLLLFPIISSNYNFELRTKQVNWPCSCPDSSFADNIVSAAVPLEIRRLPCLGTELD
ncbi:UNVERIFIED_CONTAM: hypothetical protein K2H54_049172 [Gekko kuhli]